VTESSHDQQNWARESAISDGHRNNQLFDLERELFRVRCESIPPEQDDAGRMSNRTLVLPRPGWQSVILTMIVLAGLLGASGIMLAAAAAHVAPGTGLDGAAYMLLLHATALLSGTALLQQGALPRLPMLVVLIAWALGATLFSGDIALRAFTGHRLFAMAAPTGGTILIIAWLALAVIAVGGLVRS